MLHIMFAGLLFCKLIDCLVMVEYYALNYIASKEDAIGANIDFTKKFS